MTDPSRQTTREYHPQPGESTDPLAEPIIRCETAEDCARAFRRLAQGQQAIARRLDGERLARKAGDEAQASSILSHGQQIADLAQTMEWVQRLAADIPTVRDRTEAIYLAVTGGALDPQAGMVYRVNTLEDRVSRLTTRIAVFTGVATTVAVLFPLFINLVTR